MTHPRDFWRALVDLCQQTGRTLRTRWKPDRTLGQQGEDVAARLLRRKGYTIIERGYRTQAGELDLIAAHQQCVIFVEVKTRRSLSAGHPAEAVGPQKQRRLVSLALAYLKRHNLLEYRFRFDIVSVIWPSSAKRPTVQHFEAAFEPPGDDV